MTQESPDPTHLRFRLLRLAFRLVPMTEAGRDRMRQWFLDRWSHLVPPPPKGQVSVSPPAIRRSRARADAPALGHVGHRAGPVPSPPPARLVAFYLPQFHPIAENDGWWGKGFTEWRNVARALPQFEGHVQPRLPADLGFYDLRDRGTLRAQAELASEYGIAAFCCYFYWFSGRTLLEQPARQWLDDASLRMPLCLCWANENWTRRWDGRADDVLIAQQHSVADDLAFIEHVAPYLRDPRYLRVDGKPMLLVYRPELLPSARDAAARWRQWCRDHGVGEIHLACVQAFERRDPGDFGFDAAVEFPPNLSTPEDITARQRLLNPDFEGCALDWRGLADDYSQRRLPGYTLYPAVNPGWDNEPRRPGKGRVLLHASPRRYRDWLHSTIAVRLAGKPVAERLVFINAWNEWAEGAVLEPDAALGHAWLDATRQALQRAASAMPPVPSPARNCVVIHAWYADVFEELLATLQSTGLQWRVIVTTPRDRVADIERCLSRFDMQAEVVALPNRGRDVLPFLHVANRLLDEGVDVVLKLHTKRSVHRDDGDQWRRELVGCLASPERAARIRRAFDDDPRLGLVGPEAHLVPLEGFLGANEDALQYLAARVGITPPGSEEPFVAGSMFWTRLAALRLLLDTPLRDEEFEAESGQLDGTLAHAVERLFGVCAERAGFGVRDAHSLCVDPHAGPAA